LEIDKLPAELHAGQFSEVLQEQDLPLDVEQAAERFAKGQGEPGKDPILNFGIGSPPTWLKLRLSNPTDTPIPVKIISAITWIDELQLSLVQHGEVLEQWQAGDTMAGAHDLVPGIGFVGSMRIPSGESELYLRAASPDPLVLPIEVLTEQAFAERLLEYRFVYGLIYGFLLSMIVYNSMLYIGMRDRGYLIYSVYLSLFTLLNITYTGHGFAWFWPDSPTLQNHVILVTMVLFSCSGLAFTNSFLSLQQQAPRSKHLLQALATLGIASLALSMLAGRQDIEALIAFSFALVAPLCMVVLGLTTLNRVRSGGHYYLAAMICGMLGLTISTLTVWGKLPFNGWTYGAIKIGMILQASLLALALSYKIRDQQSGKLLAERMAQSDPLTGLHNRRGFNEQAAPIWSTALRNRRPLSLIMLDLDHFKDINDRFGHDAGDRALMETARLLERSCRSGDVLARWGGEEFLLLLPETGMTEAHALAERLRLEVQGLALTARESSISLSASFGVIERSSQEQLEQLINQADRLLYGAKTAGRNQVFAEA
jgi:diguanylate cyclase (GGDEF)-like protein